MAIIENLPGSNGEILLDANARFYQAQAQGDAYVYVEKYAARKGDFTPAAIGTSADSRSAYLVKETNYTDIGGGLVTFERHFAVLPGEWFNYEQVTFVKQGRYNRYGLDLQTVYNPEEVLPAGLSDFIEYTNTLTRLAKATRTYYLQDGFDESVVQLETPGHINQTGEIRIRPDTVRVFMAGILEVTSYIITV